jgi:hypothetical protein
LTFPTTNIEHVNASSDSHWKCWPNPAKDYTFLKVDESLLGSAYELRNIFGQLVLKGIIRAKTETVMTSDLPNGTYMMHLPQANSEIQWIIKE